MIIIKTLILKSLNSSVDGVVDYCVNNEKLIVKYNINSKGSKEILRLAGMSSVKPNNCALNIAVPDLTNGFATGRAELSVTEVSGKGYYPDDIDTFALFYMNGESFKIICSGFQSLYWNISYPIGRLCNNDQEETPKKVHSLLESMKTHTLCSERYTEILCEIVKCISTLAPCKECPVAGYKWYIIKDRTLIPNFSSFKHLTATENFNKAYQDSRILLAGVQNESCMALALKYTGSNPFDNAEDCAVKEGEYWVVGIVFKEDGQYFARIK